MAGTLFNRAEANRRHRAEARVEAKLRRLADDYNKIRKTQKRSERRTENMTPVFEKMKLIAADLSTDKTIKLINSTGEDWGIRLTGYAAVCAKLTKRLVKPLIMSLVERSDKKSNQKCCIEAIQTVLNTGTDRSSLPSDEDIEKLQTFYRSLSPMGTRYTELERILAEFSN